MRAARGGFGSPASPIPNKRFLAVCGGIGAGVGALPGPGGASEGSRWEASPAGRGAPTGQPVGPDRAPAGAHERPVGMAMIHAPRWGAGHAGTAPVGALRRRSFPPATFIRASSAKAPTIRFHRKQRRAKTKRAPRRAPFELLLPASWPISAGTPQCGS